MRQFYTTFFLALLFTGFSSISTAQLNGQNSTSEITNETLRLKGTQYLDLSDVLSTGFGSTKFDGEKIGNFSSINFHSSYGYNIADNININGYLTYSGNGLSPDQGNGSQSNTSFQAGLGAWYILPINKHNLFIGGRFGGGNFNFSDDISGSTFESESSLFNYSVGVKYPWLLNDGHSITAYALYDSRLEQQEDDAESSFSGINLGFGTYNFNTSTRYDLCQSGEENTFSDGLYSTGDYFIGGNTGLNLRIGTINNTFTSGDQEFESEQAITELGFNYTGLYYPIDNLGIRGDLNYNLSKLCDDESDASVSSSLFQINLGGQYHIETVSPNLYGFGEIGVGSFGFTNTDINGDEQSDSDGIWEINLGLGYNHFFAPNLALSGEFNYASTSQGDPAFVESGFGLNIGIIALIVAAASSN